MGSVANLGRLAKFAFAGHPVWLGGMLLGVVSVLVELAAIASLQPLLQVASAGDLPQDSRWRAVLGALGLHSNLAGLLLLFCGLFLARVALLAANQAIGFWIGRVVQADLSSRIFSQVVGELPLEQVERNSIGHYISLGGDETARAGTMLVTLNQLVAQLVLAVVYFAAVVAVAPLVAVAVIAFMAITAAALGGAFRRSRNMGREQLSQARGAHSVFLDALNGLRSVRTFGAQRYVVDAYHHIIHGYVRLNFRIDALNLASRAVPAAILLAMIMMLAAVRPGALAGIDLPLAVTVCVLLLRFLPAAGQSLSLALRTFTDSRAVRNVFELIDQVSAPRAAGTEPFAGVVRSLQLEAASFSYEPTRPVLSELSLSFEAGRSYAIAGPSGSGKSTLFDLLLGFRTPTSGTVWINGEDVSRFDPVSVRRHVILIPQVTTLLNDTVARNVAFGAEFHHDAIVAACRLACADEFVSALPAGYGTVVAYQGGNLSGGQRQRLGIARALLRRPDVLLLDESTSALDGDTTTRILDTLFSEQREGILVFATHDPRVMERVDHVIELPGLGGTRTNHIPGHATRMATL